MRSCALLSLLSIKNKLDQDCHPTVLRLLALDLGETPKEYSLKGMLSFMQGRGQSWERNGVGGEAVPDFLCPNPNSTSHFSCSP